MAQIDTNLYDSIAQAYAAIDTSLSTVVANARTALDAVVDVSTTGYPDPSGNADAALEVELALLGSFNAGYVSSTALVSSTSALLTAVRTVNNFVINQTSGTDTATVKLDTFINTTMDQQWSVGSAVPTGWKNLCTDAGYVTSAW